MNRMFFDCNSLILLPDISKWNTAKAIDMSDSYDEAFSEASFEDEDMGDNINDRYI